MRVVFLSMGLAAVMSLMTGCSSSKCESVCAEANTCDLKVRPLKTDCPEYCADVEAFNDRAVKAGGQSCQAQFDAHMQCWETNSAQMCTKDFAGCEDSGAAWTECMAAHCAAVVASGEDATDPNCSDADPSLSPF